MLIPEKQPGANNASSFETDLRQPAIVHRKMVGGLPLSPIRRNTAPPA